jgi:prepilin-type N-terminal cleavage/methylation domain-containing protein
MKKGFTLIELSIVLVIISIVIGAIIGSRDLIESAKLNGIISDFKKYESAYFDFKEKYGAIPGDMPDASDVFTVPDANCPSIYNGNGDNNFTLLPPDELELYTAMDMLSKAGFIDFKPNQNSLDCTNIITNVGKIGLIFPESSIKDAGFSITAGTFKIASPLTFFIIRFSSNSQESHLPINVVLTPSETQIIDKKIDDGLALNGKFSGNGGFIGTNVGSTCNLGADYNTQSNQKECISDYEIDLLK